MFNYALIRPNKITRRGEGIKMMEQVMIMFESSMTNEDDLLARPDSEESIYTKADSGVLILFMKAGELMRMPPTSDLTRPSNDRRLSWKSISRGNFIDRVG